MKTIKVLIVLDNPIYRNGIIKILSTLEFVEVCDEAENWHKSLEKFQHETYEVVITDIDIYDIKTVNAIRLFKAKLPLVKIIILSQHYTTRIIADLDEIGVDGYLLKSTDHEELINTLTLINTNGIKYYTEKVYKIWADYCVNKLSFLNSINKKHTLSKREIEIIKLICEQRTAKDIADSICISEATVNNHRSNIMKKIGVYNSVGIVLFAVKHDIFIP